MLRKKDKSRKASDKSENSKASGKPFGKSENSKPFGRRRRSRHRHKKTNINSWEKHYTYESSIIDSETNKKPVNTLNVNIVHGLKDFLQGPKPNPK